MSNRQGVTYDANGQVVLTPGQLSFNGNTYDVTATSTANSAAATAAAALAAAAAAQATANAALPKAGGTMTGDINMSGTQKVTNMATPTAPGDATTKLYVDNLVTGVLRFKGSTDCSGNPNYPAATLGDAYVVSVAGKIGGAAGVVVEAGDVYFATATNPGGTQAAVGSSWDVVQYNLTGVLLSANNLSDVQSAATSRTNLGLGSAATYADTAFAKTANNLSDLANAGAARTNLGLGSAATYADTAFAKTANNLSDLASAATARTNLGLGTAATANSTDFATAAQGALAAGAAQKSANLSDLTSVATARTNLGLGTAATYADTAFAKTANNLSDLASAATARTNLGLGTAATYADTAFAKTANNLSDLASAATARTNLGLGTAATTASTDYATAAQGTLASTAVQRAGDTMTGNLIMSGAQIGVGGTPSAFAQIDVINSTAGTNANFRVRGNGQSSTGAVLDVFSGVSGHGFYGYGSLSSMLFGTNGLTRMVIAPSGEVGIGSGSGYIAGINLLINNAVAGTNANFRLRGDNQTTYYMDVFSGVSGHGFYGYGAKDMLFGTSGTTRMTVYSGGNLNISNSVGVGSITSPTARLHLPAGTATANTAPLKINSGTNLATPEAGAMEYDGTSLYFTNGAATRYNLTSPSVWSFDSTYNSGGTGTSQYVTLVQLAVNDVLEIEANVRVAETSNNLTVEMAQVKLRATVRRPGTATFATQILSATTDKQTTTNVAGFGAFIEEDATTKGLIKLRIAGVAGYTLIGRAFGWIK